MAESINNLNESDNQTDSDDGIIEFSNRELTDDFESALIEKNAQNTTSPSILGQLEPKSELVSTISETNNLNNYDDYIDEDLCLINGDDMESSTTVKNENNLTSTVKQKNENDTNKCEIKSILISDTSTSIEPNESEPIIKLIKIDEIKTTNEPTNNKEKTTEMVEFLLERSKLKDKFAKNEKKFSTLTSTFKSEDNDSIKKTTSNKPKSKLDPDETAFIWTELEAFIKQHEQTGQSSCGASAIINVLVS